MRWKTKAEDSSRTETNISFLLHTTRAGYNTATQMPEGGVGTPTKLSFYWCELIPKKMKLFIENLEIFVHEQQKCQRAFPLVKWFKLMRIKNKSFSFFFVQSPKGSKFERKNAASFFFKNVRYQFIFPSFSFSASSRRETEPFVKPTTFVCLLLLLRHKNVFLIRQRMTGEKERERERVCVCVHGWERERETFDSAGWLTWFPIKRHLSSSCRDLASFEI